MCLALLLSNKKARWPHRSATIFGKQEKKPPPWEYTRRDVTDGFFFEVVSRLQMFCFTLHLQVKFHSVEILMQIMKNDEVLS